MSKETGVLVLLGAGASVAAGIPLARELTKRAVTGTQDNPAAARVVHFVVNALKLHDVRVNTGEYQAELPDIERLVSAVELLANRQNLEIAPFIRDWDPMVSDLETRPPSQRTVTLSAQKYHQEVVKMRPMTAAARRGGAHYRAEREADEKTAAQLVSLIQEVTADYGFPIFQSFRAYLVKRLVKDLQLDVEADVEYLLPLLEYVSDSAGTIATLNYDLTVERCAGSSSIKLNRFVEDWSSSGGLQSEDEGVPYIKLHGSIDWQMDVDGDALHTETSTGGLSDGFVPALVYGQREKLRIGGPFLELLNEFRRTLMSTDRLIIAGYSFRDEHVNSLIRRWLKIRPEARLVIVDPHVPELSAPAWPLSFLEMLWEKYGAGHERPTPRQLFVRRERFDVFTRSSALREDQFTDLALTDNECKQVNGTSSG